MLRSFMPVGQGAFYIETFYGYSQNKPIHIVYDCGTSTSKEGINEIIDRTFYLGEEIAAVFISHFDDDHINELPELLKHCKVKNLFIPLITEEFAEYLKLQGLIKNEENGFTYNLFNNLSSLYEIKGETRLWAIKAPEDRETYFIDATIRNSGENLADVIFGKNVGKPLWEFVPYNFKFEERLGKFKKALNDEFEGNVPDVKELINNFADYKDKIKNAYNKIDGTLNTNSMVLFSGARDWSCRQVVAYPCIDRPYFPRRFREEFYYDHFFDSKASGCLYTGDYDAKGKKKWNDLRAAYDKYWNYIGCIQIPHHGSKHNWNDEIADLCAYKVVSAGLNNNYGHPDKIVLKALLQDKSECFWVSEQPKSAVNFICEQMI